MGAERIRLGRGVNVSHWLSQRPVEGPKECHVFREEDARFLRGAGFDHVRLPFDEAILWEEDGRRREAEWARLRSSIGWCLEAGLNLVLDLHILRSHHFNAINMKGENPLWTSAAAQDHLIELWECLSGEFRNLPEDRVAYEFLNEPVASDPEMWNAVLAKVHRALRGLEPRRVLVIGSNQWQRTRTVPQLKVPEGDPNILVSFHYYEPGPVTHYRSGWTALREYDGPVRYPGIPYPAEALPKERSERLEKILAEANRHYDREVIRTEILEALDFVRGLGLPIYCGEWGCYRSVPEEVRLAWYRDMVSVFHELEIPWTCWDYKGGFHIVDPASGAPDWRLIEILTGRSSPDPG